MPFFRTFAHNKKHKRYKYDKMLKIKLKWIMSMALLLAFSTGMSQNKITLTFQDASTQEIEVNAYGKIYFSDNYMYIDNGTALPFSFAVSNIRNMIFNEGLDVPEIVTETFKVYPNPVHNLLYINGNDSQNYPYALYSIDGRLLLHGDIRNGDSVDVSELPSGLYILKIHNTSLKINKL